MSSMTTEPAWAMDGPVYDANTARVNSVAAGYFNSGAGQVANGILPSGGQMAVTAGSGMSVSIAAGYAVVASGSGSTYGGYTFGTPAGSLTIATSDPVNPRIDLVVAFVDDLGSSSSVTGIQVVTGTPAPSPSVPAVTGVTGYVTLAQVLVPAGSTSVTSGNITDVRPWTAGQGGIIPVWAPSAVPAGYQGLYVHDRSSGRLAHDPAGALKQPHVLPFTPQQNVKNTSTTLGTTGATLTICTVSITVDGSTDIECTYKWAGLQQGVSQTYGVEFVLAVDGTSVDTVYETLGVTPDAAAGGCVVYRTSGAASTTPSAGPHSVTFAARESSGGGLTDIALLAPCSLYVKAACL